MGTPVLLSHAAPLSAFRCFGSTVERPTGLATVLILHFQDGTQIHAEVRRSFNRWCIRDRKNSQLQTGPRSHKTDFWLIRRPLVNSAGLKRCARPSVALTGSNHDLGASRAFPSSKS